MLKPNMPAFNDPEGARVPPGLPPVIDAHVHVFPRDIFTAVRHWFSQHAWPVRYRMSTSRLIEYLLCRGVDHVVALQYAHKPGISRMLNQYMAETCSAFGQRVTGMATVFPGEADGDVILQEAFDAGLKGLKLHVHVQCFDMNADDMRPLYECCCRNGKPIVLHAGREPRSPAYRCDPYRLCSVEKLEKILIDFPDLKICVPHLGFDETNAYREMLEKHDHLWLDTTMAVGGYFPLNDPIDLGRYRLDRIMYGSDFPNIPYSWDRELKVLAQSNLSTADLAKLLAQNAMDFFGIGHGPVQNLTGDVHDKL